MSQHTNARGMNATVFVRKLRHGAALSAAEEVALSELVVSQHPVGRGDVVSKGGGLRSILLVLEGWLCRYKLLENGKRQITSLFLPGDLCEPFGALPRSMDHTISALTPALLARISPEAIRAVARANPRIEEALWWDLFFADGLHREHLVGLGRRSATERMGHFFCDAHLRLSMVGLAERPSYDMPLTQNDLADLFGLSAVQVNRSLQELRGSGLLSLRDRRVTIHDLGGLRELALFDPLYLLPHGVALSSDGARQLPAGPGHGPSGRGSGERGTGDRGTP